MQSKELDFAAHPPRRPRVITLRCVSPTGLPGDQRDIGDLRRTTQGIVRVETVETPQGRIVANSDGDGVVCSLLEEPQAASIQYGEAHPRMQGTSNNPYCPLSRGLRPRAPQWLYPILC